MVCFLVKSAGNRGKAALSRLPTAKSAGNRGKAALLRLPTVKSAGFRAKPALLSGNGIADECGRGRMGE